MKPTDQPDGPSLRAKQMWRFEVRSDLPDSFFWLYFLTREDGEKYMTTRYSAEGIRAWNDERYAGSVGDDGLPLYTEPNLYDFLGLEGMDRVVNIIPPEAM